MQKHAGFSLIELMIVVGIIGILTMIALPSYRSYTARARFAEVITITQPYKMAVALALQEGVHASELKTGAHGIPAKPKPTKNFANLEIENGTITATATEAAQNATYVLKPNEDGSRFAVSGSCVKLGYCNA